VTSLCSRLRRGGLVLWERGCSSLAYTPPQPALSLIFIGILERVNSLVLYGPSQTGKTLWARSLGNHAYCIGLVSGAELQAAAEVDYAVFDDIRGGFKMFPSFKEWLGAQQYVSVKRLYRDPVQIKWNKPSIWLSNRDPRDELDLVDIQWMEKNVTFINIEEAIFRASTE